MNNRDQGRADELDAALQQFHSQVRPLPGIVAVPNRLALVEQFIDAIRRVEYVRLVRQRPHDQSVREPENEAFDPIKAAAYHGEQGNIDEACWLTFLAIHFGKHRSSGWRLLRDIYGALGQRHTWSWSEISRAPDGLTQWLRANYATLTSDGIARHFGNHRKYESIRPTSGVSTGPVVASYVRWVQEHGDHVQLFDDALDAADQDARIAFGRIYGEMEVLRFGRTAKFDYLTMIAKLGLANIDANSAYLSTSTGPIRGARLLFGGSVASWQHSPPELDGYAVQLANALGVGLQEMEDALCNWQKSPGQYRRFSG